MLIDIEVCVLKSQISAHTFSTFRKRVYDERIKKTNRNTFRKNR